MASGSPHPLERESPPIPPTLIYLWNAFNTLQRAREVGQGGFMAVKWSEIESWSRLHQVTLKPFEIEAITGLDDLWLAVMRKPTVSIEDLQGEADDR